MTLARVALSLFALLGAALVVMLALVGTQPTEDLIIVSASGLTRALVVGSWTSLAVGAVLGTALGYFAGRRR